MSRQPVRLTLVLLLVLLVGGLLAACGDEETRPVSPSGIQITVQPQPEATILPGCVTGELESWYEVAGTLLDTFRQESRAALDRPPEEIPQVLSRLASLRDAIASQPTPECAIQPQSAILFNIREILVSFESFSNQQMTLDQLRDKVELADARIETEVVVLLAQTQAELENQLWLERQTTDETPQPDS